MGKRSKAQIERRMARMRKDVDDRLMAMDIDVKAIAEGDDNAVLRASNALRRVHDVMASKDKKTWPTAPTKERMRQSGGEEPVKVRVTNPDQPYAHRYDWAIDRVQRHLTLEQYSAAEALRDSYMLMMGSLKISEYETRSGRSSKPDFHMIESQIMASELYHALFDPLSPMLRQVAENFILEIPLRPGHRVLSREEFGTIFVNTKDARLARGSAMSSIIHCCELLAINMHEHERRKMRARQLQKGVA